MGRRYDHSRTELEALFVAEGARQLEETGLSRFSAREVAKRVGYSIGTLYNVFASFDGLVLAINARTLRSWAAHLRARLAGEGEDRIGALVRGYFDFAVRHPNAWAAIYQHRMAGDGPAPEAYQAVAASLMEIVVAEVATAVGATNPGEALPLARSLLATVHGHCAFEVNLTFSMLGEHAPVESALARGARGHRGGEDGVMIRTLMAGFGAEPSPLLWGYAAVLAALSLGTVASLVLVRRRPGEAARNLRDRMRSWWVMAALGAGALVLGFAATAILFAGVSFLALREFLSLAPARREDRPVIALAYLTIPAAYLLIFAHRYMIYLVSIPVWVFMLMPFLMALIGQTRGYLGSTAVLHWGTVTCVYNIGFIPLLMHVPHWDAPQTGAAGLVFFLLLATEANDVLQYVCGKLFGRHKITPKVSPNKTWEGFLGGWVLTTALILLLGPVFTPLKGLGLWTVALSLPVAGFAGDLTFSAIKRDIGVKDTSGFIPGHGGVLDRIDSLTFTTPLYFHLLALFALQTY